MFYFTVRRAAIDLRRIERAEGPCYSNSDTAKGPAVPGLYQSSVYMRLVTIGVGCALNDALAQSLIITCIDRNFTFVAC